MSEASATQLVSPLNRARGTTLHARGIAAVLSIAFLMGCSAWLLESSHATSLAAEPVPATTVTVTSEAPLEPLQAASIIEPEAAVVPVETKAPDDSRYKALAVFLAKRYRVSQSVTHDLVSIAHSAGQQIGVDPLLIIAVMAVESSFNPIAESGAGAKGLMQIIPRYHPEKFQEHGGTTAVFDPETNILVGSRIIKEYLARTGDLSTALQLYGGISDPANKGYFVKVMGEKQRLVQAIGRRS